MNVKKKVNSFRIKHGNLLEAMSGRCKIKKSSIRFNYITRFTQ